MFKIKDIVDDFFSFYQMNLDTFMNRKTKNIGLIKNKFLEIVQNIFTIFL